MPAWRIETFRHQLNIHTVCCGADISPSGCKKPFYVLKVNTRRLRTRRRHLPRVSCHDENLGKRKKQKKQKAFDPNNRLNVLGFFLRLLVSFSPPMLMADLSNWSFVESPPFFFFSFCGGWRVNSIFFFFLVTSLQLKSPLACTSCLTGSDFLFWIVPRQRLHVCSTSPWGACWAWLDPQLYETFGPSEVYW